MTLLKKNSFLYLALITILLASCKKDDDNTPVIPEEEEVITTLIYTLSPEDGSDDLVFTFRDLDGDGGNAPVITTSTLQANTNYTASITLSNESETPAEDITAEIQEEDEEHQFFFQTSGDAVINISYDDQDSDGNPIGLTTKLSTSDANQGQLTIILRHEPAKDATGVKDGNIANAGGETDIQVVFDINVE